MNHEFLLHIGMALIAAFAGGLIARLLKLPVLIGYLVAGVFVGPHTPGFVANREAVEPIAQLGVALLMFAVGVHFSLPELLAMWRTAVFGGGLQMLGTIILGVLLGVLFGWGVYGGLFLGCAIALSSTAVMLKVLEEKGEQGTSHGKAMLGILIVQDLSLVLMIILLPAIGLLSSQGMGAVDDIALAFGKAILFLIVVFLLAVRVVPWVLGKVARTGSRELFLLLVVCLCLGTSAAAEFAGLGLELGAFLAGIIISETDYSHEVFNQVKPLRDVFACLFFVSVGMLLDPGFLMQNLGPVLAVVVVILIGKSAVSFFAVYSQGSHGRTAVLAGLGLAQIGEFSFVLASIGSNKKLIPDYIADVILAAALITLLIAPFVYHAANPIYRWLNSKPRISAYMNRHSDKVMIPSPDSECGSRVLILGYGQVGRYVSDALHSKGLRHLIVDYDSRALDRPHKMGIPAIYGDVTSETVMDQAEPARHELAVVALPDSDTSEMAVRLLKQVAPNLPVVVRVQRGVDIPRLRSAGADAVIHGEFEAGTEMIRQSLDRLDVPDGEVDEYIDEVRHHRYRQEAVPELG